jgi:hypothetical protein
MGHAYDEYMVLGIKIGYDIVPPMFFKNSNLAHVN